MRAAIASSLATALLIVLAAGPYMRAVAVEQACRTIVEAGLVRTCTVLR